MFAFLILFIWFVFFLPDYLGPCRQLRPGQPAGDAAAHRAGMVLPALLRHPARDPVEAFRRHRHVLLHRHPACSRPGSTAAACARAKYRPIYKWFFWLFAFTCVALGYLGSKPPEGAYVFWARVFTVYYFAHFLIVMPVVGWFENAEKAAGLHHGGGAGQRGCTTPASRGRQRARGTSNDKTGAGMPLGGGGSPGLPVDGAGRIGVARAEETSAEHAVEVQDWSFGGPTVMYDKRSCSAASRFSSRSARRATASSACASATWPSRAGPSSRSSRQGSSPSPGLTRSPASSTTRAIPSIGSPGLADPIIGPYKNDKQARVGAERRAAARPVPHRAGAHSPPRSRPGTRTGFICSRHCACAPGWRGRLCLRPAHRLPGPAAGRF